MMMDHKNDQNMNRNNNTEHPNAPMSAGMHILILSVVVGTLCLLFAILELRQWAERRKERDAPECAAFCISPLVGDVTDIAYSATSDDISPPYVDLKENKLAEKERKSHGKKHRW